eukprot:CAMPEP_0197387316 /NCGR_PEP_ID=MMETSP1165-20131217/450_1 /TAXON_ID=284809 /ORGANISM="Chrysocystis fragilis, Strain CCMP3189" /LENGTH=540 /DNA_ID=CAMNT_0042912633 /DNA_START=35 /DNA_END=1657 /DNA_ORIENTATION=+
MAPSAHESPETRPVDADDEDKDSPNATMGAHQQDIQTELMPDNADTADSERNRKAETSALVANEAQWVEIGLDLCERLLGIAEFAPVVGNVFGLAKEILLSVRGLLSKADDVAAAGRRVVSVLEILDVFAEKVQQLDESDQRDAERRVAKLGLLLVSVKDGVSAFAQEGFLWQMLTVTSCTRKLAGLDKEIRIELQNIMDVYDLGASDRIMKQLKSLTYRLETAIEAKVTEQMRNHVSREEAIAALANDRVALLQIGYSGRISQDALLLELTQFRAEFRDWYEQLNVNMDTMVATLLESFEAGNEKLYLSHEALSLSVQELHDKLNGLQIIGTSAGPEPPTPPDSAKAPLLPPTAPDSAEAHPLSKVFDLVLAQYADNSAEMKAVNQLNRLLREHKSRICKDGQLKYQTKWECAPLHVACALGRLHLAQALFVQGFDVNAKDEACRLPFHYASLHGHVHVVQWIVSLHEKQRFIEGSTKQTIQELLKAPDTKMNTALDLAIRSKQVDVESFIRECLRKYDLSETIKPATSNVESSSLVQR